MGRSKKKADHRAATRGAGFTGLPHVVQDSLAHRSLNLWGRAVLMEILREFHGYNNGTIAISQRQLAERLGTSNFRKISRAVADLFDRGLIDVNTNGDWKARMAREYRLTFVSTTTKDGRHVQATEDYQNWSPPQKSGADDVSSTKAISADAASSEHPLSDDASSSGRTLEWRKTFNLKNPAADASSSLIDKPYPQTETRSSV